MTLPPQQCILLSTVEGFAVCVMLATVLPDGTGVDILVTTAPVILTRLTQDQFCVQWLEIWLDTLYLYVRIFISGLASGSRSIDLYGSCLRLSHALSAGQAAQEIM